jgi:phosphoribosyl 1,2-cyclic phosphate phosphodiesterase
MPACSLEDVRYCLQTHPHADHLDLSHLLSRSADYGVVGAPVLHFYASRETLERAAETFERDLVGYSLLAPEAEKHPNFKPHQIQPLEPFTVGPYSVIAFPANHAPGMGAMVYAIELDGRAVFYGMDTAPMFEQTWQAFREHKMRFDVVILDHTYGPEQPSSDHLNAKEVIDIANRMRVEGVLHHHSRVFATHIAHEGNPAHSDLVEFAAQHGYEVAYDGLVVQV